MIQVYDIKNDQGRLNYKIIAIAPLGFEEFTCQFMKKIKKKQIYFRVLLSDKEFPAACNFIKSNLNSIQLYVDGQQYGDVQPGEGFYYSAREHAVPHAANWHKGSILAPFDQQFYISLGLRVGGVHDFADSPDKPWKNRESKGMLNFWGAKDEWFPTWYDAAMKVDYVHVYAL